MAYYSIEDKELTNIADAIREKTGSTEPMNVNEMAIAVSNIETALDSKTGYVTLAETILTEDANEIIWTKGANGEVLSDYKDFFIYWVGKFDVTNTAEEAWICRANDGATYFCYTFIPKQADVHRGFWWEIKEIGQLPDGTSLYKTTFPEKCLMNFRDDSSYGSQGLADNNITVKSDISTGTAIRHIRFGSLSSGSKMVAGSKAVLLGRKR